MPLFITRRMCCIGFVLAAMLAAPAARAQQSPPVLFFAAASLQSALNAIAVDWGRASGKRVIFSYAASSALVRQLAQGAPADLFATADLAWMDEAQAKGLVAQGSRTALLGNRLVLVAAQNDATVLKIEPGFDLAAALGAGHIATGNPGSVPAGRYAQAALMNLGVWDKVSARIAGADNVRAALALVARGEAKFGIVYATDAKSEPKVRIIDIFPEGSHPKIVYPVARVQGSTNPDAAAFLAFLQAPAATRIFEAEGFSVLK
jgi:molybdate transport system substrate-binding protein